ncbi:bifunctional alpha,alpha-trehalose-phosphate synthase (UDP-forming)/trehalose-phosphatase [candidate division KSB1 bacterium]|nr:bifunctional alpha,alpha-trehalose-phosphate synthase (UDP-forming)/trehalose-phosphatase [candidate division KSB1 bacterium]
MSKRFIIISNRLPINITKRRGEMTYKKSAGGLATGMASFYEKYESLWIGWPGIITDKKQEKESIRENLRKEDMVPVFLSRREQENYYEGFSNKTIWPLFHYFSQNTIYEQNYWETYKKVNIRFAEALLKFAKEDDIIWVHDYHLMLLPHLIREKLPASTIGFFLHIPFPSYELFRTLPWRDDIMQGLLGADLIGFHTFDYVRHFLSSCRRLKGLDHDLGRINWEERIIKADSFPMGIDYKKYHGSGLKREVKKEMSRQRNRLQECKLILSIDRLDYSKGILQRLEGFNKFLEKHPEYREKVTLIMVVVPSRSRVESYRRLKHQLDTVVGRINGVHGTIGWTPIWYLYRSLPFNSLTALYNIADIGLVTPFRDGMNLVAKEFIACKRNGKGVLILSEMAGAADELGESLLINPNDIEEIADAIYHALQVPEEEQKNQIEEMQKNLKRYDIIRWANDFIDTLIQNKEHSESMLVKSIGRETTEFLVRAYRENSPRIMFIDYDGTLVPFSPAPELSKPDKTVLQLLKKLATLKNCTVVLNSGRQKDTLEEWFGSVPDLNLCAEHGAWLKKAGENWNTIETLNQDWKNEVIPILEKYAERTPGSFIEAKDYSLVWHYRKADIGLGEVRAHELMDRLVALTANLNLQVMEGNMVVEIKNAGVSKGRAAQEFLEKKHYHFIFGIGDAYTDEMLFQNMPDNAHTIKVGFRATVAKYRIKSYKQVRELLQTVIKEGLNEKTT